MGSLRGRLSAALVAFPAAAQAQAQQVCDTARPGWDGTPVGAFGEALALFLSPAGLILLAASLLALRYRQQWLGLATIILWTVFITLVTMADPTGQRMDAMAEGCVGAPTLFIVVVAAICVAIVLMTKPRPSGPDTPET